MFIPESRKKKKIIKFKGAEYCFLTNYNYIIYYICVCLYIYIKYRYVCVCVYMHTYNYIYFACIEGQRAEHGEIVLKCPFQ